MFSFIFLAVGSSKNKAGNTLFFFIFRYCVQLLLLFLSFLLSDAVLFSVLDFASLCVLSCHGNVNAENTVATEESDFFFFFGVFIYFDVFIFSFLSSRELACLQSLENSLTVLWEGS